jgi:hypothetical protein
MRRKDDWMREGSSSILIPTTSVYGGPRAGRTVHGSRPRHWPLEAVQERQRTLETALERSCCLGAAWGAVVVEPSRSPARRSTQATSGAVSSTAYRGRGAARRRV